MPRADGCHAHCQLRRRSEVADGVGSAANTMTDEDLVVVRGLSVDSRPAWSDVTSAGSSVWNPVGDSIATTTTATSTGWSSPGGPGSPSAIAPTRWRRATSSAPRRGPSTTWWACTRRWRPSGSGPHPSRRTDWAPPPNRRGRRGPRGPAMRLELDLDFAERFAPDDFFFGVAYAPYCEGAGSTTGRVEEHRLVARREGGRGDPLLDGLRRAHRARRVPGTERVPHGHRVGALPAVRVHRADRAAALGRGGARSLRRHGRAGDRPRDAADHHAAPLHASRCGWGWTSGWTIAAPTCWSRPRSGSWTRSTRRLMARGGKKMSHFLVYNEPNLIPLFYPLHGHRYPGRAEGPGVPAPRVRHDAVALHQGVRRHPRPVRGEGLGDARTWGTRSRACAPYEYDKQLDDLLRLRSWGVAREDAAAKIAECRAAWRARMDDARAIAADGRAVRAVPRDDRR